MPGKNVWKKCAAKHNQRASKETGCGAETALFHPKKHECANGENMQRLGPVDGDRRGQKQEEPVRRIEQGSLQSTEIGRAAKDVRIPQSEISLRQFSETEFSPCEVLQEHIAARMSDHTRAAREQNIGKHRQRHC